MKFKILVKTNKKENLVFKNSDGSLSVNVKSSPIEGKANKEIIKVLSDYFKKRKSEVIILNGEKSKLKLIEVL